MVKFWRTYAGNRAIEVVDGKALSAYLPWRKDYYHLMPTLPKNAKLHPTDKTLRWEIMLGKAIIKFAHDQGYRGNKPLASTCSGCGNCGWRRPMTKARPVSRPAGRLRG